MKKILFVTGGRGELGHVHQVLHAKRDEWEVAYVDRADEAWQRLVQTPFDAAVIDTGLPGLKGLDLIGKIVEHDRTKQTPVIAMVDASDRRMKKLALKRGAADLLNKPIDEFDLQARLQSVLRHKVAPAASPVSEDRPKEKSPPESSEYSLSRLNLIWRLGQLAEYREELSGNHVIRVGFFSRIVARRMNLPEPFAETLFQAAPLHDIGNIGIPDIVLLKRETLTPREWEMIRQHCVMGEKILRPDLEIAASHPVLGEWLALPDGDHDTQVADRTLDMAATIALTHHERFDGSGYPQKLVGESIPIESRIVAICDVFDALTSERPYREPHPEDVALEIIRSGSGKHFDPAVCAAFLEVVAQLIPVREALADDVEALTASEPEWDAADWVFEDDPISV